MRFRWIEWNVDKVLQHGVMPAEAEAVVEGAARPYPRYRKDGKYLVWGSTAGGRLLQVVYILDRIDDVFVIHARPLTEREERRWRKARRRTR